MPLSGPAYGPDWHDASYIRNEDDSGTFSMLTAEFFESCNSPTLLNHVELAFSVPVSYAPVGRVFPIRKSVWREQGNSLHVQLVQAELQIKLNFCVK